MVRSIRLVSAAIVLAVVVLGATGASAHGLRFGHGGGAGFRLVGGHGWGHNPVGFWHILPGGCYNKFYINSAGFLSVKQICF